MQPGIDTRKMLKLIFVAILAFLHQTFGESVKGAVSLNAGVFDKVFFRFLWLHSLSKCCNFSRNFTVHNRDEHMFVQDTNPTDRLKTVS